MHDTGNLKLKEEGKEGEDKAKTHHHEDAAKKFAKPALKDNLRADSKGAKKTSGVRKTGTA